MSSRNYKWTFAPCAPNERGENGESLSMKLFRERPNRSLIREFAQNSIDAQSKREDAGIVEVHLSYMTLGANIRTSMVNDLKPHIEACIDATSKNNHSKNPFASKQVFICENEDHPISCLKISDYNTTGMMFTDESQIQTIEEYRNFKRPAFNACVRQNGASDKMDAHAGGSHGQGKNAGMEKSPINVMYYSTMTEETTTKSGIQLPCFTFGEGVVSLCNHVMQLEDNIVQYKRDGFFDSHDGYLPDQGEEIPECFRRTVPGTDAYIVGLEENDTDKREIVEYMLRSFFPAIAMNKVVFDLFGEKFYSENLPEKMEKYFQESRYSNYDQTGWYYKYVFNPRPYCLEALLGAGKDDNHLVITADPNVYPHLDDTKLYLWKDESIKGKSKDIILYMRDKGMVIDVKREKFGKGFYGVLISAGKSSDYLRLMENVTHDAWDKQQLCDVSPEEKSTAEATLREIEMFVVDAVNKVFPHIEGAESSIPGLNEIMSAAGPKAQISTGAYTKGDTEKVDFDIFSLATVAGDLRTKVFGDNSVGEITVRKSGGINKKKKDEKLGQKPESDTEKIPEDNGEKEEDEKDKSKERSSSSGEHDTSGNQLREGAVDESKKGKHTKTIPAVFMQKSIHEGVLVTHRVQIESAKEYDECSMVLNVADMGNGSPLAVKSIKRDILPDHEGEAKESFIIEGASKNTVRGFTLYKGINIFDVVFEDAFDHSLLITAYEIK